MALPQQKPNVEEQKKPDGFFKTYKRFIYLAICFLIGAAIWFYPTPAGFSEDAWHLFAIFFATVVGFILQPVPTGAVTFIAIVISVITGILNIGQAISGFAASVIWLIVAAFIFSAGLLKTGLGERIAYLLMGRFGKTSLSLGYSLSLGDLVLSLFIPSNTARSGGIMYPIVRSISEVSGSTPDHKPRKIGAYLIQTVVQTENITSGLTLTGMAGNLMIIGFISQIANIEMTWIGWLAASIVPCVICLVMIPWLVYKLYPPEMKETPQAKIIADEALAKLGPMKKEEKVLGIILLLTIIGWATTTITGIDATTVGLTAVCAMLITSVINWKDVTSQTSAWDTMIWMGGMYGIADNLAKLEFFDAFAVTVSSTLDGISWIIGMIILFPLYAFSAYAFASGTTHILTMYPIFLGLAIGIGAPPYLAGLVFAFASAVNQTMTHYASGPAAVFFAGGYVEQRTWWKIGFQLLVFYIVVFGVVGSAWWKLIGLW
ncbi:DASS family sodium-coupled anion symporter [Cytobacillus gottheilii]|uniref:DASS family sodium-coupled anion symporter n=1 Tax=Cytobacillus gottheilii TaxID=859144 RepID=UPI0009B95E48|nr:DASS family sodium-coupled anion symporter [Cytobacillus gottheilii]